MAAVTVTGLVLRTYDWSESSRIAVVFTAEYGKMRVLAKGGRRLRSPFEVALDLLNLCSMVVYRRAGEGLETLAEARIEERFPGLRKRLPLLYGGYYLAELLDLGTQDHDPHPALYESALQTLRLLGQPAESGAEPTDPEAAAALMRFELAWLQEIGYGLTLEGCSGCGVPLEPDARRLACSAASGGWLCGACLPTARESRPLSRPAWEWLASPRAGMPPGHREELRSFLGYYVSHHLGRRPRLLAYLA